jgi:hypothetical protein
MRFDCSGKVIFHDRHVGEQLLLSSYYTTLFVEITYVGDGSKLRGRTIRAAGHGPDSEDLSIAHACVAWDALFDDSAVSAVSI